MLQRSGDGFRWAETDPDAAPMPHSAARHVDEQSEGRGASAMDGEKRKWSTDALRAAARLLFADIGRETANSADLELASGVVLRLAAIMVAERSADAPAEPVRLPDWLDKAINDLATRANYAGLFALGQALDLWHILWFDTPLTHLLWVPSDVPLRTLISLRRLADEGRGLARRNTARIRLNELLRELADYEGKMRLIDATLAAALLDDALKDLHNGLANGEFHPGWLVSDDQVDVVERLLREQGADTSGKRRKDMVKWLQALKQTLHRIEPLACAAGSTLEPVEVPLAKLSETHRATATLLRTTTSPVEVPQGELDALAASLVEALEQESTKLTAALRLTELGSHSSSVLIALRPLHDLDQHLIELESTEDTPDDAVEMLAFAREVLTQGDVEMAKESISEFHQIASWHRFHQDVGQLRSNATELPEEHDFWRHLTAAERSWSSPNSSEEEITYARKYLEDAVKSLPPGQRTSHGSMVPATEQTVLADAKRRFASGDPDGAIELLWPVRSACPSPQKRALLFKVFREYRRYAQAQTLFSAVERVDAVRAYDCYALSRVALAAHDLTAARQAQARARRLGANPLWLQIVDRELHPVEESSLPHEIFEANAATVISWVKLTGAHTIAPVAAKDLVKAQKQQNGPAAATEVVVEFADSRPELIDWFVAGLRTHEVLLIPGPIRAKLVQPLRSASTDTVIDYARTLRSSGQRDESVDLLRAMLLGDQRRDALTLAKALVVLLHQNGSEPEAEDALATYILARPHDFSRAGKPLAAQPQTQPWGLVNLDGPEFGEARRLSDQGSPNAIDEWIALARQTRGGATATAMHFCVAGGRPEEALRLVADADIVHLPYIGVLWNLACAYSNLGRNHEAAELFRRHAGFMARRYQESDLEAIAIIFATIGEDPPQALVHQSKADDSADRTDDRNSWLQKFSAVVRRGSRNQRAVTKLSAKEMQNEAVVNAAFALAERLLDREYLLTPPRVDRGWEPAQSLAVDAIRLNAATVSLDEGNLTDCAAELRGAWHEQPTHEGLTSDFVSVLIGQEEFEQARQVAEAGGERAERFDLLAAVAHAEKRKDDCRLFLTRAQELKPSESRAFALAQLNLTRGALDEAVHVLKQEAMRHLPGILRVAGGAAVALSGQLDAATAEQVVLEIVEHAGVTASAEEQVDWIIDHDLPFDLIELRHPLRQENLDRLLQAFAGRKGLLIASLERRLLTHELAEQATMETYDLLVRQALAEGSLYQAARYLCAYEKTFGPYAVELLETVSIEQYPDFEHVLLMRRAQDAELRSTLTAVEHRRIQAMRAGLRAGQSRTLARQIRNLVDELDELSAEHIVAKGCPTVEAAFDKLAEALEHTPDRDAVRPLQDLWRADLASARDVLFTGRALTTAEYDKRSQRRGNIRQLVRLTDDRLSAVLRKLQDALYRPWRAAGRVQSTSGSGTHRFHMAASPEMFAGRAEEIGKLYPLFLAIAERNDTAIHHVYGPPKMGKSSLSRALTPNGLPHGVLPPGVVPLRITCSEVDRGQPFRWLAKESHHAYTTLAGIHRELALPDLPPPSELTSSVEFGQWLNASVPDGMGWLLLLDEFDQLARRDEGPILLNGLRRLHTEGHHPFGVVLFSQAPPKKLAQLLSGVTVDVDSMELRCLDAESTRLMVDRLVGRDHLSDDQHRELFEATSGYPGHVSSLVKALKADLGDVATIVDIYAADPDRVAHELLPLTIGSADLDTMSATLRMLSERLTDTSSEAEIDVLAHLDETARQFEKGNVDLLVEAGVLRSSKGAIAWQNRLVATWAATKFRPGQSRQVIVSQGLDPELEKEGFEGTSKPDTVRRDGQEYDIAAVKTNLAGEVDRLLRGVYVSRPHQYAGRFDYKIVVACPEGRTLDAIARSAAGVEPMKAVRWIASAAHEVAEVHDRTGLAHGWLSKNRLHVVGGQVSVEGWAESAIAHTGQQWPARWEHGHAMRKPEGRATAKDDAFALAVVLANLLNVPLAELFAPSDDGVVNNRFLDVPDFEDLESPANLGEKLGPLLKKLLREPESPKRLRDDLQSWLGLRPVTRVSEIVATLVLRLAAGEGDDWDEGDVRLKVEVTSETQHLEYNTLLPGAARRIARDLVNSPKIIGNDDRTQFGQDLADALLGTSNMTTRRMLIKSDPQQVVPRVVIQASKELQHIPWEMAAVTPNRSLAGIASVVRRLIDHPVRLPSLARPEQHLVVGRPGMVVPDAISDASISSNWKEFRRHRGDEPILHFIGEGEPGKLFCGEDAIEPGLLGDLLYRAHTRLALLTACNSNIPGDDGMSAAVHLSAAGVPAVIGMSGKVEDEATMELAALFLSHLIETGDVELSLFHARRITSQINRVHDHPVLFLNTEDGALFTPSGG